MLSLARRSAHIKVPRGRAVAGATAVRVSPFHSPIRQKSYDTMPSPADDAPEFAVDDSGLGADRDWTNYDALLRFLGLKDWDGRVVQFDNGIVGLETGGVIRSLVDDYAAWSVGGLTVPLQSGDYTSDIDNGAIIAMSKNSAKWEKPYMNDEEKYDSFDEDDKERKDHDKPDSGLRKKQIERKEDVEWEKKT
ncbi:hypothetical protein BKA93DRAFT_774440 [Sparassis latifolia]|uniref:Uncharacterized protein n=1 Tax=Sparassis crispa TaxID=139825 RepID=A0A401H2Z3_9APHY|nr:hypothetical protein SCP_1401640 [Sparassis crispa]GBE88759.1 hypothetical protein SCP_1401640 [Sparassis crispa]